MVEVIGAKAKEVMVVELVGCARSRALGWFMS